MQYEIKVSIFRNFLSSLVELDTTANMKEKKERRWKNTRGWIFWYSSERVETVKHRPCGILFLRPFHSSFLLTTKEWYPFHLKCFFSRSFFTHTD